MSVRRQIAEKDGLYFVTFTCARWLPLFEIANAYDVVYRWFDFLKSRGHYVVGYVIMPNHVHALIAFRAGDKSINAAIGNGKRFMAYEIVDRLQVQGNEEILFHLSSYVNKTDRKRGKLHEVFEPSFDWKECIGTKFIEQKLDYIHENPCRGNWGLASEPIHYVHSSARFYLTGEQGVYEVVSYAELEDIDLTKRWEEV